MCRAARSGVNLPRWGLKRSGGSNEILAWAMGVNLPRWGLKLYQHDTNLTLSMCKFTPLGFETLI